MSIRRIVLGLALALTPAAAAAQTPATPEPIPTAGPATPAGTTGLAVRPGVEIFGQYALRLVDGSAGDTAWFHAFELPRAHASLGASYGPAQARFVLEAVRSASEGALLGVAGDSLVLRVREAWAGAALTRWIELRVGVVPTLTIPEIEGTWRLRAVAPTPLEVTGLGAPADLGVTLRARLPADLGWAAVGVYNGEGYTNRELNRGKNLEAAFAVHVPRGPLRRLTLLGSYVFGSSGTGLSRADRLTGALLWQGDRVRGGVSLTAGWGVDDDGARRSLLVEGFARVEPIARLIVGLRASWWQRDDRAADDQVLTLLGSVGWRVFDPLEVHLALSRQTAGERTRAALPGIENTELRAVTRVVF